MTATKPRTLFLHIGRPKTGTSFIQAAFANGAEALAKAGVLYPDLRAVDRAPNQRALNWHTTGGNGQAFAHWPVDIRLPDDASRILVSWEGLTVGLAQDIVPDFKPGFDIPNYPPVAPRLRAFCQRNAIEKVEVILFVRNPLGLATARYLQGTKGQGRTEHIDTVMGAPGVLQEELILLSHSLNLPDPSMHVFNYDVHKRDLLAPIAGVLGVPREIFVADTTRAVNRSFSQNEIDMVLAWNEVLGTQSRALGFALCDEIPARDQPRVVPSRAAQEMLIAASADRMVAVNALLPESERLWADYMDPPEDSKRLEFTRDYMRGLGSVIGQFCANQAVTTQVFRLQNAMLQVRCALLEKDVSGIGAMLNGAERQMQALEAMPAAREKAAEMKVHLDRLRTACAAMAQQP